MALQDEIRQIEAAIAALEAQRPVLGDAVVDTAIAPLREKLAALTREQAATDERKRVSVLFADVSGYTALSERLDPEDVADIMNRLFERLEAQISRYGGTVDKYSGDAVMALFGAPKALENHEEMAVRAALAMQEEVAAYSAELQRTRGFALKMRIGINTGDVLAGLIGGLGSRSYTVMGDTVNLAARLEQACPVGRVLVSAATANRLHAIFEFEPPRQITVKGKSEPVTVYVVVGEKAERGRVRGLEGFTAPMVGRDRELAELKGAFRQVVEEPRWQVVAVVGEAGIGKTRLRREFVAWINDAYPDARVLSARCYVHTRSTPYHLVAELVRGLLELPDEGDEQTLLASLQRQLAVLDPAADSVEQRFRLGSLASVLGIGLPENPLDTLTPEQRRDRIMLSLEQLFLRASAHQSLVLVVDDLHWADVLSSLFLEHLLRTVEEGETADGRALVLLLSRPPDDAQAEDRLNAFLERLKQSPHRYVGLRPLEPDQSRALVTALLREQVPPEVVHLVVERAQGNPFFVEEILRALIEDGVLRRTEAGWVLTRPVEEVEVPPSVQDLLAARLDKLPPTEKRVLQYAAIIGRTFWPDVLQEALGEGDAVKGIDVGEVLNSLERRQIALRHGQSGLGEGWEWTFRHALIQEVAYRGVRKSVRRRVHRQVAQRLEQRLSEHTAFLIPLIAYHYERGDQPDKAVEYLQRAGEQAAAQFANDEALRYLTRALLLLDQTGWPADRVRQVRYELLMAREAVYHLTGQRDQQAADLEKLEALAEVWGDPCRLAEVALRRAAYAEAISDYPAALQAAQQAARWAEEAGAVKLHIEALIAWSRVLWQQGELEEARQHLNEALILSRRHRYWQGEAASLHYLGTVFYLLGDLQQARAHLEEALTIRRHMNDRHGAAVSLNNLVAVYHGLGDYAMAKKYCEEALHAVQIMGDRKMEAATLNNLAGIHHVFGDLEQAHRLHERALRLFRQVGSRYGVVLSLGNLALTFFDLGAYQQAEEYARQALREQRAVKSLSGEAAEMTHLALALEALGELGEASRLHMEARQLREEIGQIALALENTAGLARIALQQGHLEEALDLANTLYHWIQTGDVGGAEHPFRLYLTVIDIFLAAGRHQEARQLVEEAVRRLEEQAGRISDPAVRRSFLEQVPLHRAIRERAVQVGISG